MSQIATLDNVAFTIPDVGDEDWGQNVTDYLLAIPSAVLQKSGGTFTLSAEVDFGASFGLKSLYYKSRTANPADAGQVRLARADVVSWRNQANGANLDLGPDASNVLGFNGVSLLTLAGGTMTGDLAFANQKSVRLMELTANGTNYIGLAAPDAVTANVTLKLPDGAGSAGQVLSTDGSGVLSWINAAGGGVINTGVKGYLAVYSAAGTTLDDVVTMTNTVSVAIAAHGQGSVYTIPDTGSATADFVMTAGTQTIAGAKTLSGVIVLSNNSTSAFSISQASSFKVDSTNALVSIGTTTMTYPLYVSKSSAGANVTLAVENSEAANAASHARLYIITGGASGGDPFETFYNGVTNWSVGLDNSDSDALCWTGAATLNGTNLMRLSTAGALEIAAGLTAKATTNQIILGVTNTLTITSPAPASSAVYTIPDVGTTASFILTAGAQTITGAKTFASSALLLQEAGSTDVVTIAVAALTTGRTYTIPDAGGAASFVMTAGAQTIAGAKSLTAILNVTIDDAVNNNITEVLSLGHNTSGTPGNGIGTEIDFYAETSTTPDSRLSTIGSTWTDVTHATRTSNLYFQTRNSGTLGTALTITGAGQLQGGNGLVGTPTFTFSSDPDTGIFSGGANLMAFTTGGVLALYIDGSGCLQFVDGAVGAPSHRFQNDPDTGIYSGGTNILAFTTAGVQRLILDATGNIYGTTSGTEMAVKSTYNSVPLNSIGGLSNSITIQNSKTFTVDCSSSKCFLVQMGNGDAALVMTSYLSATITITGSSGIIVASSTPSSGQLGIFKSSSSHTISFKSGSALTSTANQMQLCFIGNAPSAATNWA